MANDILLDENGDLAFDNGDFSIGDSMYQDALQILKTPPGTLRQYGKFGMNTADIINEDGATNLRSELRQQLKLDKKNLKTFKVNGSKLSIDVENL